MKLKVGLPPMFEEIAAALPGARGPNICFAWGDTVYTLGATKLHPAIEAHESVHGARQLNDPTGIEGWWKLYISNPEFRLLEELPAHVAEYQWWRDHGNRHERRAYLGLIAKRLASPLYGSMIPRHKAETILRKGTT